MHKHGSISQHSDLADSLHSPEGIPIFTMLFGQEVYNCQAQPSSTKLDVSDRPIIGFTDLFNRYRYRLIGTDTPHIGIGKIGFGIGMVQNQIIGIGLIYGYLPIYLANNQYLLAIIGIYRYFLKISIGLIFIVENWYRYRKVQNQRIN